MFTRYQGGSGLPVHLIKSVRSELLHTVEIFIRIYLERKVTLLKKSDNLGS